MGNETVLVFGGTRFIGAAAVRQLAAWGHAVTVFHRGETEAPLPAAVQHLHGDRRDPRAVADAVERLAPSVVLDMVAFSEQDARLAAGVLAGRVSRVVLASSIDVYRAYERLVGQAHGVPDAAPLTEDAPLRTTRFPRRDEEAEDDPALRYDKLLVERVYADERRLTVTCLRLPFVFGPGDYRRRVQGLLGQMRGDRDIVLSPAQAEWRSTRGYVDDVGAAIALAVVEGQDGGLFNVGDPHALATAEWIARVGRLAGWRGELVVDDAAPEGLWWAHHLVVDTTRIRQRLGFSEPVGLEAGLARTVRG
jgi:nucleoside-diphosphate-sugar epimerase